MMLFRMVIMDFWAYSFCGIYHCKVGVLVAELLSEEQKKTFKFCAFSDLDIRVTTACIITKKLSITLIDT